MSQKFIRNLNFRIRSFIGNWKLDIRNLPNNVGLATIPIIIILSLIILAIGASMMTSGFIESLMSKTLIETQESFYLSDSGIDDALLKIARDKDLGKDTPINWGLPTSGTNSSDIIVSGDATNRVIDSTGIISEKQRNLEAGVTLNDYGKITATTWEELTTIWYDSSWLYRKKITFTSDSAKIPDTQTNFPVLISLSSDADLAADAQDDGDDILFTSVGGAIKLSHEIEKFDGTTGQLVAWVKVPSLSPKTIIYMYYGNATASNQQLPQGVWDSNFKGVWHSKDFTTTTILDSTSNGNTGTKKAVGEPVETDGKISKAQSYDGTDDYVNCGNNPSLQITNSLTLEAWVDIDINSSSDGLTFVSKHKAAPYRGYYLGTKPSENKFRFIISSDGTTPASRDSSNNYTKDSLTYLVAVYDASAQTMNLYVSGNLDNGDLSGTIPASIYNTSANARIGSHDVPGAYMDGIIDEVRISNTARSANWIKTSYSNQDSPSTFYTLGTEETH